MLRERPNALVVTWASGGNLPPLLAAAELLASREFDVDVLARSATREDAKRRGLATHAYRRAPEPDVSVPFEAQAGRLLVQAAGVELGITPSPNMPAIARRLDLSNKSGLRSAGAEAARHRQRVLVDLTDVAFMDSSGSARWS